MASDAQIRTGSFRDIRELISRATPVMAEPRDSYLDSRREIVAPQGPIAIFATWPTGGGHVEAMPGDEFVCVLSGALTITTGQAEVSLPVDSSGVIPGGIAFDWTAEPGTVAVIMRSTSGPVAKGEPLLIDESAPLNPSNPPVAELLIGETPSCRSFSDFKSVSGEFSCGTWDSTPYHRKPMLFGHCELMHILDGAVTFSDQDGRVGTFGKGSIVLLEHGGELGWKSDVYVKKVFSHFRAAT